jgi:hypothetical protein
MGVDSLIVGNSAKPYRLEHDGQTIEFRLIDQSVKAEWERRLYLRAMTGAEGLATVKGQAWLENRLVELEKQYHKGGFGFLTETSIEYLQTPAGMDLLITLLTDRDLVSLAGIIASSGVKIKAILHTVLRESFPGVKFSPPKADAKDNAGEDSSPN